MEKKSTFLEVVKVLFLGVICILLFLIYTKDSLPTDEGFEIVKAAKKQGQQYFKEAAQKANRDGLTADVMTICNMAKQFYTQNNNSYEKFEIPEMINTSGNGYFKITKKGNDLIEITAIGKELGIDGVSPIKIKQKNSNNEINKVVTIN